MLIHRDYFQPSDANARPIFRVSGPAQKQYSESLKTLCRKGASERVPPTPTHCPRCGGKTGFYAQLCYMQGCAGAYVLIVCTPSMVARKLTLFLEGTKCQHRHWPVQKGPSETLLVEIEEERQRSDVSGAPTTLRKGKGASARTLYLVGPPHRKSSAPTTSRQTSTLKAPNATSNALQVREQQLRLYASSRGLIDVLGLKSRSHDANMPVLTAIHMITRTVF